MAKTNSARVVIQAVNDEERKVISNFKVVTGSVVGQRRMKFVLLGFMHDYVEANKGKVVTNLGK